MRTFKTPIKAISYSSTFAKPVHSARKSSLLRNKATLNNSSLIPTSRKCVTWRQKGLQAMWRASIRSWIKGLISGAWASSFMSCAPESCPIMVRLVRICMTRSRNVICNSRAQNGKKFLSRQKCWFQRWWRKIHWIVLIQLLPSLTTSLLKPLRQRKGWTNRLRSRWTCGTPEMSSSSQIIGSCFSSSA